MSRRFARLILAAATFSACATAQAGGAKPAFLVILDPGHGGEDTGAIRQHDGQRVFEKDITLGIALKTARTLKARGIPVVLTRGGDQFLGLDQRTELANQAAAHAKTAIFVSIHANSSDEPRSSGIETYVFNATSNEAARRLADLENGKRPPGAARKGGGAPQLHSHGTLDLIFSDLATTANYGDSLGLACTIQGAVVDGLKTRNRGIRQALFYVLMQTRMPSILFEPGFVSNPAELARLLNPSYQAKLAQGLAQGILKWKTLASRSPSSYRKVSAIRKTHCPIH